MTGQSWPSTPLPGPFQKEHSQRLCPEPLLHQPVTFLTVLWDPTPESGCSSRSGGGVECPLLSPIRLQHPVPSSIPNKDSTVAYTEAPNSRYFCAPEVQSPGGQIPCLSYVFGLELFMKERTGRGRKGEGRRKKKERKGEGSEMGRRVNKKIIINLHSLWSLWEWPALMPH